MELSPASSNVGYFLLYPDAPWEADPNLGTSSQISRAAAVNIVAAASTIATADIYGFDWDPHGEPGSAPPNPVIWDNLTPEFFPYLGGVPIVGFSSNEGNPLEFAAAISWFSAYSGGGTGTPTDPGGGVNALLIEVTATSPSALALFVVDEYADDTFLLSVSAFFDGGQSFDLFSRGLARSQLDTSLTRLKVWRTPTRIWPVDPAAFWTDFIGSREII